MPSNGAAVRFVNQTIRRSSPRDIPTRRHQFSNNNRSMGCRLPDGPRSDSKSSEVILLPTGNTAYPTDHSALQLFQARRSPENPGLPLPLPRHREQKLAIKAKTRINTNIFCFMWILLQIILKNTQETGYLPRNKDTMDTLILSFRPKRKRLFLKTVSAAERNIILFYRTMGPSCVY